jgi:hypothetical protein
VKAIHLIQKDPKLLPKPISPGSKIFESGFWKLRIEQTKSLINGDIYFHQKQKEPSFFGGIIKDCRVQTDGEWEGRVIFTFEASSSHRGKRPQKGGGWDWEMNVQD